MSCALQGALDDFRARIRKYEEVYETITNRDLHYIKLIDMCGRLYHTISLSSCSPRSVLANW